MVMLCNRKVNSFTWVSVISIFFEGITRFINKGIAKTELWLISLISNSLSGNEKSNILHWVVWIVDICYNNRGSNNGSVDWMIMPSVYLGTLAFSSRSYRSPYVIFYKNEMFKLLMSLFIYFFLIVQTRAGGSFYFKVMISSKYRSD